MKRITRFLVALCLVGILGGTLLAPVAYAEVPYKTYTLDGYENPIETQSAYIPDSVITKIGETFLSTPRDMVIGSDGLIYIADAGNKRIIVSDIHGNYMREFGNDVLVNPNGVYVTNNGHVYVADRDAAMVFEFSPEGTVLNQYGRPNHPLYGEAMDYKPLKIVVNEAGIMFIISESNTNGIIQISPTNGGTFLGYFGANDTKRSIGQVLLRIFATEKQRAKRPSNTPPTPDNLAVDDQGLIYTVTRGQGIKSLKRLNIAGKNVLKPNRYDMYPAAVTSGNYENVYMATTEGFIYEFNKEGEMLFAFGGKDDGRQRIGLSKKIEAISVDHNDKIYLLDSDMNQIHIFKPTEFTGLLHEALKLYANGRYTESKAPLTEILEMNNMFGYANKAMGLAYLHEGDNENALRYSRISADYQTYSDSFWEVRNSWLQDNLIITLAIIVGLIIIWKVLISVHKKKGIFHGVIRIKSKINQKPFIARLNYALYYIKHPVDGCYGVRWEGKSSFLTANIILSLVIIFFVISKYLSGFLFKPVRDGWYELGTDIGFILIVFIVITACNYLVCTINDGEGSFKQIYSSFAYCLTPYLLIQPIIFALTQVVTINEVFLVTFPQGLMYAYIIILVLITIRELNNIKVKETAKVVFLTFFTVLIFALLLFVLYVLWIQVFDFVMAISGEVVYRLGN